jgi:hypothetical protein
MTEYHQFSKEQTMNKQTHSISRSILFSLVVGLFVVSCGASKPSGSSSSGTSAGQTLLQDRCSVCHSLDRVTSAHKTNAEWTTTVDRMVNHGAQLNLQEQQTLIDYLTANYK